MYEEFYGLQKAPFHITPDPEFLFLSPSHREALASITYGVERRKGFIVVLGEVGLGKTTVVRSYLSARDTAHITLIYVFNANVSFKGLLDAVYSELGVTPERDDVQGMVEGLHHILIDEHRQGRNVVLIVDEVQNMPVRTLESLRVLSNLETTTDKLLQIVLVGQPEFADTLDRHELRQLRQRIAVRCTLSSFTNTESLAYIEHRLNLVGVSTSSVLSKSALRGIVKRARGVPRTLNVLCDSALVTGLGYQKKPVTAGIVREVIRDLQGTRRVSRLRPVLVSLAALLLLGASIAMVRYLKLPRPEFDIVAGMLSPEPAPTTIQPPAPPDLADLLVAEMAARVERVAPASPQEPPAPEPEFVATRVVQPGERLSQMAIDVYGSSSLEVIQRIVDSNPTITNANRILSGTSIRFPDISDLQVGPLRATEDGQDLQP